MFLSLEQEAVFITHKSYHCYEETSDHSMSVSCLHLQGGWHQEKGLLWAWALLWLHTPPNLLHVQPEAMWCRNSCLFRQRSHFGLQQATMKFALNNATVEEFAWKQPPSKSGKKLCQEAINKSSHRYIIMIKEQSYIGWKHGVARTCSEPLCSVMKIVAGKQKGSKYIHLFWQS